MLRFNDLVSELVGLQDHGEVYRPPVRADPEHISLPAEVAGRGGARKTQPGRGSFCSYHTIVLKESSVPELNFPLQEVFEVKEALDAQSSLSKRQRAEMEAMAHEMSALKVSKLKHEPTMNHELLLLPEIEPEPEERAEADQHSGRRRSPGRTCSILNHSLSNANRQTFSLNCFLPARL